MTAIHFVDSEISTENGDFLSTAIGHLGLSRGNSNYVQFQNKWKTIVKLWSIYLSILISVPKTDNAGDNFWEASIFHTQLNQDVRQRKVLRQSLNLIYLVRDQAILHFAGRKISWPMLSYHFVNYLLSLPYVNAKIWKIHITFKIIRGLEVFICKIKLIYN